MRKGVKLDTGSLVPGPCYGEIREGKLKPNKQRSKGIYISPEFRVSGIGGIYTLDNVL